jgi:predicted transcriptional regulator
MKNRSRQQGELERMVLEVLWSADGDLGSQEILERLDSGVALTTLLTVLSRLSDKGLVERSAGAGRSLLFRAATTREQHAAEQLLKIIEGTDNPALAFAHFTKGLDKATLKALRDSIG